jgi:hypothetical protein
LAVATWVQNGSLAPSPMNLCCGYYPANSDLLTAWPMVLLHNDALAGLVQVCAAVLGAVSVAGIARSAGPGAGQAAGAGAVFILTPAVLAQAPTSYVDVLLAAWVLAALHGLVRFAATARPSRLVVPALCAGLLAGTKGTGPVWALAVGLSVVGLCWWHLRRGGSPGDSPPWRWAAPSGCASSWGDGGTCAAHETPETRSTPSM